MTPDPDSKTGDSLQKGRAAFVHSEWPSAHEWLSAADRESPLGAEDLGRLSLAARLTGHEEQGIEALIRAHRAYLDDGQPIRAARCAFQVGFELMGTGDLAQAGGWFGRADTLVEESGQDCVEAGYLLLPPALRDLESGQPELAMGRFEQAAEVGRRFDDLDLVTLARLGRGQSMIRQGMLVEGAALLDEAMAGITAGDVSPVVVGVVFCAVLYSCQETFDLRRAREWTSAFHVWMSSQQGMVPFRGQCMVFRAEVLQLAGSWKDAMDEALLACSWLGRNPRSDDLGAAFYLSGELHRLRGEFARAEDAYRQASLAGRRPEPGLALLRLAQGRAGAAAAAIGPLLDETRGDFPRARILGSYVEIMLAAGEIESARTASGELTNIATAAHIPVLDAMAAYAEAAVLLSEQNPRAALVAARRAWAAWRDVDVPYEAARSRLLIAAACRELGDDDTAALDLDAARRTFAALDAAPDLARADAAGGPASGAGRGGLTVRELEVLRLVAAGLTNRQIASELVISEKTVARHVANTFNKLGVSSRAAVTAYAYEHGLLQPPVQPPAQPPA